MDTIEVRQMRGQAIFQLGDQINRIDAHSYRVSSQSGNGFYDVLSTELGWTCSCPDHIYRGVKCKHIWAVDFSLKLRNRIETQLVIKSLNPQTCVICGSDNVVKHGLNHNKNGDIQRISCKNCGKRFTANLGFEGMKATPQIITSTLQLYFTGESLRNVQKFLRLQGVNISHQTVYNWIGKYVRLMEKYLEQIKPQVSDTWRADELYVKIKGNMRYLFALMDDETRFWIAQEVAESKYRHDARSLFQKGKEVTGKRPMTVITDGLPAYQDAFKKEFFTLRNPRTKHIRHITIKGDKNNNKMERMNGEVRDREKVMRGLKKADTPILKGYQIFHNYLRQHEGLDGKTPAEACGIKIEGENKWMTIIQNVSHVQKVDKEKYVL